MSTRVRAAAKWDLVANWTRLGHLVSSGLFDLGQASTIWYNTSRANCDLTDALAPNIVIQNIQHRFSRHFLWAQYCAIIRLSESAGHQHNKYIKSNTLKPLFG